MGFSIFVILLIKLFCSDKKSCIQINGNLRYQFHIGKGIRQGCPLSMMIYVIFKEALYQYIKSCNTIKGIPLPNNNTLKISGYADDTNLFTMDQESILNIFSIIRKFESATGAILNKNKTKIYGLGLWKNKVEWPIPWLTTSLNSFKSLGVIFDNDYEIAVTKNWDKIFDSVDIKIKIMQNVKLTIYQKAVMINCIIYSKLWYISHIYPLPLKHANKINKLAFHYLWGKKWEPIKRSTLCLAKCEGGLGILDIYHKSRGILVSSFLKAYLINEDGIRYLLNYYNYMRTQQLLNITAEPVQVSYIGSEYYMEIITIIQKCTHMRGFPHISAKSICANIIQNHKPTVEGHYGLCNWKLVWNNLCSVLVLPNERETLFRYLHEILPTKKRLKTIRKIASSVCDFCTHEETNTHVVYQCERYKDTVAWFRRVLQTYCDVSDLQMIRLSFLETPKLSRRSRNATVFFLSTYIVGM